MTEEHWQKIMKAFLIILAESDPNQIFYCAQEAWCQVYKENWDLFCDEDALDVFLAE